MGATNGQPSPQYMQYSSGPVTGKGGGTYAAPDYGQQMGGQPTGKGGSFNAPDYSQNGATGDGQQFSGKGGNNYSAPGQMASFAGNPIDPRTQWAQSQGFAFHDYGPTAPPTYEQATQWGSGYGGGYGGGSYGGGGGYGGYPQPQPPGGAQGQYPQGLPPMGPPTGGPGGPSPGPNPGPGVTGYAGSRPRVDGLGPNPGANPAAAGAPAGAPPAAPSAGTAAAPAAPANPNINPAAASQVTPTVANQAFGAVPTSAGFTGLSDQDKAYAYLMQNQYRQDLRGQPGSAQLYQDLFKGQDPTKINQLINDTSYNNPLLGAGGTYNMPGGFDPNTYSGPLKAQYEALVKQKGGTVNPFGTYTGAGLAPSNANAVKQRQLAQAAALRNATPKPTPTT